MQPSASSPETAGSVQFKGSGMRVTEAYCIWRVGIITVCSTMYECAVKALGRREWNGVGGVESDAV